MYPYALVLVPVWKLFLQGPDSKYFSLCGLHIVCFFYFSFPFQFYEDVKTILSSHSWSIAM
jgi:hypothetical protein